MENIIQLTPPALSEFSTIVSDEKNQGKSIRLVITGFGWGGPQLGLALDEPKEDDILFQENEVTVLGDGQIKEQIAENQGLTIEFSAGQGFQIKFGKGCGDDGCAC